MKKPLLVLASLLVASLAWSQTVDEGELKSVGEREIVFESYTGTHSVFDTAEEIVGIGRALAIALRVDGKTGDFFGLYSVVRAVDPAEAQKLDADLIILADKAGVDHIKNLRRIIAGYVETAFGYSRADAELLATFTTYYNAVYRGKIQDLAAKYSAAVMGNLSAENAGIALSYREWPGKTRILIPHARKGTFGVPGSGGEPAGQPTGALSTTELTQKEVVEQLRNEPDKGLEDRKAMVDLKEREVEAAKENIAEEEKKLEERKAEVAARETTAQPSGSTQPAGSTGATASTRPKQPEATSGSTAAKPGEGTSAGGGEPTATAEEKAMAEEKAAIAEKEKEIAAEKEVVAAKETEIARDREGIVEDEKTTPATAGAAEPAAKPAVSENVLFLTGRGSAEGGRIVVIDPVKRASGVSSTSGGITVPDVAYFKDSVVVLARESGVVHLLLLDPKTLAVTSRGQDAMYAGSYLHSQAGGIYAVTIEGTTARLGRYDATLARTALSVEVVDKDTYIRIFGEEVYVSAPDGTIMVLAAADLSKKGQVGR